MSSSRYLPGCTCQEKNGADFELRVLSANVAAVMAALERRVALGLCMESERYLSITMITTLVVGMACRPVSAAEMMAGSMPGTVVEEDFEHILSTLVDDVRLRRAEMEALNEAATNKGARQ